MLYISGFHLGLHTWLPVKALRELDLYDAVHRKVGLSRGDSVGFDGIKS